MPVHSDVQELLVSLELGRARSPDELAAVAAEIEHAFVDSPELRKMSRPPKGLWKKYLEEVLPLIHLVRWLYPEREVLCQPNLADSGNYDATITFPNGGDVEKLFVEFTYAKDGYEESLRMEVLNDKGQVNMLGELTHWGTKNTGRKIDIRDEVVLRSRTLEKLRRVIIDRMKAKASKKYGLEHILVVVFDDYVGFRSHQDLVELDSSLASEIDLSTLDFGSLYLLGSSGNILRKLQQGVNGGFADPAHYDTPRIQGCLRQESENFFGWTVAGANWKKKATVPPLTSHQ